VARAEPQRFRARLQDAGGGGAAFDVPTEAAAALGERKRPPVTVTIGDYTFRTTVAEAKRADTRARRVAQTVDRVRTGAPRP